MKIDLFQGPFTPAVIVLLVLWAIAFIILLILAILLLSSLYKASDKSKADVVEEVPPPDKIEVPEMILSYREYCSRMMFNSHNVHPYLTFDTIEDPLSRKENLAKHLVCEPIFINMIRDLCDNSDFHQVTTFRFLEKPGDPGAC